MAHAYSVLTCLVALSLVSQPGSQPSGPPCGCVSEDATARGLEHLTSRDWRQIDRSVLEAAWPQALPCEPGNGPGLERAVAAIARCCERCAMCGGAAMDAAERLATIDLWVCPRPLRAQRAALRALTQAVIRSEPSITPTSASRTDEREVDGYSWVSNGESFLLRTDAVWIGDTWIGNFKLGRCRSEAVTDTWRVDGGSTVAVIRADVERGTTARELWFDYVSTCVFEDRACHNRELDRLWPTLRSVAGRHEATAIHIAAENCVGTSVSFSLDRTPDEQWKGGLWSPPRK